MELQSINQSRIWPPFSPPLIYKMQMGLLAVLSLSPPQKYVELHDTQFSFMIQHNTKKSKCRYSDTEIACIYLYVDFVSFIYVHVYKFAT